MRVLWVDADGNPWTDSNGWQVLEAHGLQVQRVASLAEAESLIPQKDFDLLLLRAELIGAPAFMVRTRKFLGKDPRKLVLASSEWSKEQFRTHSKTEGAAHRYARVPMPPEGFLNLLADLFSCSVEELGAFSVEQKSAKPAAKKAKKSEPTRADSEDVEVLRKYLAMREDQLQIAEGEREEQARENERLQKEAHSLQIRLRELEHLQDELTKKLASTEEERAEMEQRHQLELDEAERNKKIASERAKNLEAQLTEAGEKYESLRSRVRKDIRKIRENERDLEARLELARKDSETLLQARDQRVLELQRKIDALEFDLDQVQDSRVQAQMEAESYLAKLSRVSRALQVANHMIDDDTATEGELEDLEPEVGGAAEASDSSVDSTVAMDLGSGAAEAPPADEHKPEELHELSPELAALANDGEATQMISPDDLKPEEEPGSTG